jgi:hypothetical protein
MMQSYDQRSTQNFQFRFVSVLAKDVDSGEAESTATGVAALDAPGADGWEIPLTREGALSRAREAEGMAKKQNSSVRRRSNLDDPKGARRSADLIVGTERVENVRRIETAKYRAEIDPRTRRPKR